MQPGRASVFAVHARVFAVHARVFAVHARVFAVHGRVFAVHARVFAVHARVFAVHARVCAVHARVFAVHGRVFAVHARVCAVHARELAVHARVFRVHACVQLGGAHAPAEGGPWSASKALSLRSCADFRASQPRSRGPERTTTPHKTTWADGLRAHPPSVGPGAPRTRVTSRSWPSRRRAR